MDLIAENRVLKEAILGLRGLAVLEATVTPSYRGVVQQIDATLASIGLDTAQLDDAERDLYGERDYDRDDVPSLQQERELRDAKLDDPHRGAVPREFPR